jgi:putative hydrolase of the HAD superfamily
MSDCDALVLDFGGVISRTVFETHREAERALGLSENTLTWMGPFDPAGDPLWRAMQNGEISERDYYYARARETGALVGEEWNTLPQFLQRIRGDNPADALRPEALQAIAATKSAMRKVAILSNELDLFYGAEFRARLPFIDELDLIVDATYTKILKPDPRAYALVADGLGLSAERCVFVDDQIKNVRGAVAAGMKAVHFDVREPKQSYAKALALLDINDIPEFHNDAA